MLCARTKKINYTHTAAIKLQIITIANTVTLPTMTLYAFYNYHSTAFRELFHHKHKAKCTFTVAKKEEEKRPGVFWSSSALVYISIMTDDKVEVRPFMRTALTHPDAQANESHLWSIS